MANWTHSRFCWRRGPSKVDSKYLLTYQSSESTPCFLVRWAEGTPVILRDEAANGSERWTLLCLCTEVRVQQVIWPPRLTEHAKDLGCRLTQRLTENSDRKHIRISNCVWNHRAGSIYLGAQTHLIVCLFAGGSDGGDEHNREKIGGFQTLWGQLQVAMCLERETGLFACLVLKVLFLFFRESLFLSTLLR